MCVSVLAECSACERFDFDVSERSKHANVRGMSHAVALRALGLAAASVTCFSSLAACTVSLPSGVFSCADGKTCPPGQTCGADEICRTGSRNERDAEVDAGADSQTEAGSESEAGANEAGVMDSGADSGAAGAGGQGGSPAAGSGGGSGNGGSGGQVAPQGFHVVSTQPARDGMLEDLGAAIKVAFSAALDTATVTSDSVKLLRDGAEVPGALNATKTDVTFKPDQPWTLAARYELQLTDAVHDSKDRPLEPYSFGFTTRDGHWQREKRTDGTDGVIAASGDGFAALAWAQPGTMYPEIWSSQFTPPSTWSSPGQVKDTNYGVFLEQIAVNRKHHIGLLYATISHSYSAIGYTSGPSWTSDSYVSSTSYDARILLNEQDELIFACDQPEVQNNGGDYGIKGSRFTLGATSPTPIQVGGPAGNNSKPGLALLDGTPQVVWQHATSNMQNAPTQIMFGTLAYEAGTPLSANGVVAANAVLAGDPKQGSIIAAWEQSDPTWTNAWSSRRTLGGAWSNPVRISDDQSSISNLAVAIDPSGRAVAVWRQSGRIASAHFAPSTGWSMPEKISATDAMNIDPPYLALDAAGNGLAAWTQDGANTALNEVWVARYLRDDGWQAPGRVRVSDIEAGTGSTVSLAVDDYGRAFVVWTQANQIWSARFD
jgi:hypothetical protein